MFHRSAGEGLAAGTIAAYGHQSPVTCSRVQGQASSERLVIAWQFGGESKLRFDVLPAGRFRLPVR